MKDKKNVFDNIFLISSLIKDFTEMTEQKVFLVISCVHLILLNGRLDHFHFYIIVLIKYYIFILFY